MAYIAAAAPVSSGEEPALLALVTGASSTYGQEVGEVATEAEADDRRFRGIAA